MTLGDSVTSIQDNAFEKCYGLTSITIPNYVTAVGDKAFYKCSSLTSVSIGSSVTSIGYSAFEGCKFLYSIHSYTYHIDGISTCGLSKSASCIIHTENNFQGIGSTNLDYFNDVRIENDKQTYALVFSPSKINFKNCLYSEKDKYILPFERINATAPKSLIHYTFHNKEITEEITSEEGFTFTPSRLISENIFKQYGYSDGSAIIISLKKPGTLFDEVGFSNIQKIETLTISGDINGTDVATFNSMTALKYLDISDANIVEGGQTYYENYSTSNNTIGSYFFKRINLDVLYLPKTATKISASALRDSKYLYLLTLPPVVTSIGSDAFSDCASLTSFTIPNTITKISNSTFYGCSSLTTITIPNSVTSIGQYAFGSCNSLSDLTIGNSVSSIDKHAFSYCSRLYSIIIPKSVTSIGNEAFYGCSGLRKVYSLNPTPPAIYSRAFDSNTVEKATLHVCKGALGYYWLNPEWKRFRNITDNVLFLDAIPDVTYGDGKIDLAQYAPADTKLTYKSSNNNVVRIEGNMMQIVGAGSASVGASLQEQDSSMEIFGQLRQFNVDKADLLVTVADITITEGDALPDFSYLATGLKYDDSLDDIESLPQPLCEVNENTPEGIYPITFTEGSDRNYNISTKEAKVEVTKRSGLDTIIDTTQQDDVIIYNLNGNEVYRGPRCNARLKAGIYIAVQGRVSVKIYVK